MHTITKPSTSPGRLWLAGLALLLTGAGWVAATLGAPPAPGLTIDTAAAAAAGASHDLPGHLLGIAAGMPEHWLAYAGGAAAGVAAGFLLGMLGIGGALIVIPALYAVLPALGVAAADVPHVAVATSLLVMVPGATIATALQWCGSGLDRRWLARLVPGVALGAAGGALMALVAHGSALSWLFIAQSVYYGTGLMRAKPPLPDSVRARLGAAARTLPAWAVGPLCGGFCASIGMGGGSLLVPYLRAHKVALLRATATSCALNLTIAAAGTLALLALRAAVATPVGGAAGGAVCWPAAGVIGTACALAVPLGIAAAPRVSAGAFRRALGGVNLLGAAALLARTLWV